MPEQLLHRAQVGAALEQVRRGGVPQAVGTDVGGAGHVRDATVHEVADRPLVDAPTPGTEEDGRAGTLGPQRRPAEPEPELQGSGGRTSVGDRTLLASLAEDPHHLAVAVEVVDVETDHSPTRMPVA